VPYADIRTRTQRKNTVGSITSGSRVLRLLGAVANIAPALAALRYTPDDGWSGPDAVTLNISDAGCSGSGAPASAAASVVVTTHAASGALSVAIPAGLRRAGLSLLEDSTTTASGIAINAGSDTLQDEQMLTATGVALHGTVSFRGGKSTGSSRVQGTLEDVNMALAELTYVPTADFSGSDVITITVFATDLEGSSAELFAAATIHVDITAVADPPRVKTPNSPVHAAAGAETRIKGIDGGELVRINDPDHKHKDDIYGSGLHSVTLEVSRGTFRLAATHSRALHVHPISSATILASSQLADVLSNSSSTRAIRGASLNFSCMIEACNAALAHVMYTATPVTSSDFVDSFRVTVKDSSGLQSSATFGIQVTHRNQPPQISVASEAVARLQAVVEDTVVFLGHDRGGKALVQVHDVDAGNVALVAELKCDSGYISFGNIQGLRIVNGEGTSWKHVQFEATIANINSALARMRYTPADDFSGRDSLSIKISDGVTVARSILEVRVAASNDRPVLSWEWTNGASRTALAAIEDEFLQLTQLRIGDADATMQVEQTAVSPERVGDPSAADIMSLTIWAKNGSVRIIKPCSGLRVLLKNRTTPSGALAGEDLGIASLSGAGIAHGPAVALVLQGDTSALQSALKGSLVYLGNQDWSGDDVVTFVLDDGGLGLALPGAAAVSAAGAVLGPLAATLSVAVEVAAVNDSPILPGLPAAPVVVSEDHVATLGHSFPVANDVDAGLELLTLSLNSRGGHLRLALGESVELEYVSGPRATTLEVRGPVGALQLALADLTVRGQQDWHGHDVVVVVIRDAQGGATQAEVAVVVTPVNDSPVVFAPETAGPVAEDDSVAIRGVVVTDVDVDPGSDMLLVRVSADHGLPSVVAVEGLRESQGRQLDAVSSSGSSLELYGTLGQINTALEGLTYQGDPDWNGLDLLTINVNDLGGTGAGGAKNVTATVQVTVIPVDDPASLAWDTTGHGLVTDEDVSLSLGGVLSIADADSSGSVCTLNLSTASGAILGIGNNTNVTVTEISPSSKVDVGTGNTARHTLVVQLRGLPLHIKSSLSELLYTPKQHWSGRDTLVASFRCSTESVPVVAHAALWVLPVNDPPLVRTGLGDIMAVEDDRVLIDGISITDPDLLPSQLDAVSDVSYGAPPEVLLTQTIPLETALDVHIAVWNGSIAVQRVAGLFVANGSSMSAASRLSCTPLGGCLSTSPAPANATSMGAALARGSTIHSAIPVGANTLPATMLRGLELIHGPASQVLALRGSLRVINTALETLTYVGKRDFSGTDALYVVVNDRRGKTGAKKNALALACCQSACGRCAC
jgi:hypothetical protein